MYRALDNASIAFPLVFTAALWAGAVGSFRFVPDLSDPAPELLRAVTLILPPASAPEPVEADAQAAPVSVPEAIGVPSKVDAPVLADATEASPVPLALPVVQDADDAPARKGKVKKNRCNRVSEDITALSDTRYEVKRSLVAYHTSSIDRLMALGWSRPYDEDGQKGIYVSGFGCTSDPWLGGFRRGDVVQSVNGKKTHNFLQVWFTWQKVKKDEHFEVVVLREGRRVLLTYDLV